MPWAATPSPLNSSLRAPKCCSNRGTAAGADAPLEIRRLLGHEETMKSFRTGRTVHAWVILSCAASAMAGCSSAGMPNGDDGLPAVDAGDAGAPPQDPTSKCFLVPLPVA